MTTQATGPARWIASVACMGAVVLGHSVAQERPLMERDSGEVRVESDAASVAFVFEGFVLDPDGAPAEGAVVVSSAGGKAVADWTGHYRLEVRVPFLAESVQVTAVGRGGTNRLASQSIALSAVPGPTRVDPLVLAVGTCQPGWVPTFGPVPGVSPEIVNAMVVRVSFVPV